MRRMMAMIALLGVGAADPKPTLPDWMAGCWQEVSGDTGTEECWMPPKGGMMLGSSRTGHGDTVTEWESMQIVLNQETEVGPTVKMAFWAAPNGVNRTLFGWSANDKPGVAFYNVALDYPQRIRYWREGPYLLAEIAKADGSKAKRWKYRRVS